MQRVRSGEKKRWEGNILQVGFTGKSGITGFFDGKFPD